jgi:ribonuclease BN (tRNA processing enzyme)
MGCDTLDYLVLTHYDTDHVSGVESLLSRMEVETMLLSPLEDDAGIQKEILSLAGRYATPTQMVRRQGHLTFGEATLRAAKEAGLKVKANAPTPEAPSMVKALDIYCGKVAEGQDIEDAEVREDSDKEEFIRAQQSKLQKKTRTRTPKKSE